MKIDIRSEKSLYIIIDEHTYYIDNSTNEQIVTIYKSKDEWNILKNLLSIFIPLNLIINIFYQTKTGLAKGYHSNSSTN